MMKTACLAFLAVAAVDAKMTHPLRDSPLSSLPSLPDSQLRMAQRSEALAVHGGRSWTPSTAAKAAVPKAAAAEKGADSHSNSALIFARGGAGAGLPAGIKLLIGAGGIYAAFMYVNGDGYALVSAGGAAGPGARPGPPPRAPQAPCYGSAKRSAQPRTAAQGEPAFSCARHGRRGHGRLDTHRSPKTSPRRTPPRPHLCRNYGLLQEDVFSYAAADGGKFTQAWFLNTFEALANVIVGFVGMMITGATPNLPMKDFAMSGAGQVCAKAFTSLALAQGVSFPVVTLAKSGKMVPVMVGSIILGGARYSLREYAQVLAIIGGTCLVSMAKKKKAGGASSSMGLVFILLSLTCDGIVGGLQKKLKVRPRAGTARRAPPSQRIWVRGGAAARRS